MTIKTRVVPFNLTRLLRLFLIVDVGRLYYGTSNNVQTYLMLFANDFEYTDPHLALPLASNGICTTSL